MYHYPSANFEQVFALRLIIRTVFSHLEEPSILPNTDVEVVEVTQILTTEASTGGPESFVLLPVFSQALVRQIDEPVLSDLTQKLKH